MCATANTVVEEPHYLHCDNPDCGQDLPFDGPYDQHLVGTLCPACGSDLLTQEDYDDSVNVINEMNNFADMMNEMSKKDIDILMKSVEVPEGMDPEAMIELSFHVHNKNVNITGKVIENQTR